MRASEWECDRMNVVWMVGREEDLSREGLSRSKGSTRPAKHITYFVMFDGSQGASWRWLTAKTP